VRASIGECPPVRVEQTCEGTPGIVDVWYWIYESFSEATLADGWSELLTVEERERYHRFRFERDRRLYLATRALVRTVLSRYAAVSPGDWRFVADTSGKPRIAAPNVSPALHFNLANTPGIVTCAVSVAHDLIGIDVERIDRTTDFVNLADRYFAPSESREIRAVTPANRPSRFFTYWTLKESYVKARGVGLSFPLDRFSFVVDDNAVRISFHSDADDVASAWAFASLYVPPTYLMGVAAKTSGPALSLRVTHVVADRP
jgi:4'-phosphopantetheinyl transferase